VKIDFSKALLLAAIAELISSFLIWGFAPTDELRVFYQLSFSRFFMREHVLPLVILACSFGVWSLAAKIQRANSK